MRWADKPNLICLRSDAHGRAFDAVMTSEMQKISSFYIEKVEELDVSLLNRTAPPSRTKLRFRRLPRHLLSMQTLRVFFPPPFIPVSWQVSCC